MKMLFVIVDEAHAGILYFLSQQMLDNPPWLQNSYKILLKLTDFDNLPKEGS